ncbi:MAG: DMT family transporter [Ferrovibrio sp.]|uniref:DMT family transporter n=1 Tax=Ferrovibrio sp. TaxID=1917215 RepID=UPI00391C85A8
MSPPASLAALPAPLYARLFGYGTRRGVASMILGMAAFIINDTLIKLASASVPTGQLITMRNIMAATLIVMLVVMTGQAAHLRRAADRVVVARSLIDVIATLCYLLALFHMPIGNVTAINMATPLAMTAAAAVFMGVPVGWRRWSAIVAGFLGVLLIVQPEAEGFNAYSLLAIAAVVFIVARDLTTRRIDTGIPSLVITLTNAVFVLLGALALSAWEGWVAVNLVQVLLLAGAGLFLIGGYLLIVDAFRHGDLATVGPFRYTGLIWALLSGFLVWGDIPNLLAFAGIVIVVASGLYVLHRERVKAREEAAANPGN